MILSACAPHTAAPVVSRDSQARDIPTGANHYRVQRGDTLYSIAWQVGMDFKTLAALNGIRPPYTIYPGQKLRLRPEPYSAVRTSDSAPSPAPPTPVAKTPVPSDAAPDRNPPPAETSKPDKAADTYAQEEKSRSLSWIWPTQGIVVQRFSSEDPTRKGLKIEGSLGQPVRASEAGKIVYSGSGLIGYGRLVIIKHDKDYLTAYGHNQKLLVKEGDEVAKGESIAEMGSASGGTPVLHFEMRRHGAPVDPLAFLPRQP